MTTSDPFASALSLAAAIRSGEISPLEAVEHYLERMDACNGELNAFAFRDDDTVREQAKRATEHIGHLSSDERQNLSPFFGVPIPIKDLDNVEGWPTSYGSEGVSNDPAPIDDLPVARLRRAGFIFTGKTTTPEFGAISVTESKRLGATRNPWNTDHTPGGSSGGAAAAVASGMAPVAHASDGGGSIRIPASCTGLVGLKASRNRITGWVERLTAGTTNGVVTTTVADSAAILDVMSEQDTGAWNNAPTPQRPFADELNVDPGRLRIRVTPDNALGIPTDQACVDAVNNAAKLLESLGHDVTVGDPNWPDVGQFLGGFLNVWATITAGTPVVDFDKLEPHNIASYEQAKATSSLDYCNSHIALQESSRALTMQFGRDYDILVTPTMAIEPLKVGAIWNGADDDPGAPILNATPMAAFTAMFNVSGQPAISLPLHTSDSGLPIGVQFVAAPWREDLLIRLASQIEAAQPFAELPRS